MLPLDQDVTTIHPYAKRLRAPLKRLGIVTVRDLLLHTPVRHEDLRTITAIRDLRASQHAVIRGRITTIVNRRSWRRHLLVTEALLSDATGTIRCVWFQQPYLAHAYPIGTPVVASGMVETDAYGFHLKGSVIERDRDETLHAGRLVPIYALVAGISQKQFRLLVRAALPHCAVLPETLPERVRTSERLMGIAAAARELHFPTSSEALATARERFAFEEAFTYLLRVRASREELTHATAPYIAHDAQEVERLLAALPFPLTGAQRRATQEIFRDMAGEIRQPTVNDQGGESREIENGQGSGVVRPMQRILNGDVGSGKTVVAAIAAFAVARAGSQTAYLAPTEILAMQQAQTFVRLLMPLGIRVALWTRVSQEIDGVPVAIRAVTKAVRDGSVGVVIGTHAILSPKTKFHALALAVIDEQHRFGVEQRAVLRGKAREQRGEEARDDDVNLPHLLSMTATPIPRTLALTLLGDLHVSLLDELPPGRSPTRTTVVSPADRVAMTHTIRAAIDSGQQVFVVCPKIDSEAPSSGGTSGGEVAAIGEAYERAQRAFPGVAIGLLHGRLRKDEQRMTMDAFAAHRIAILIATTVIEVGVDQPNACVMVIEDAERFGLAQLHQLRGRVGRGRIPGTCFLTTRSEDPAVRSRLQRVAECADGFRLAEIDLEERGPGAVIGGVQSGWPEFRYAMMDAELFRRAQAAVGVCDERVDMRRVPAAHLE